MTFKEMKEIVTMAIQNKRPVVITGAPGVGKSALAEAVAKMVGQKLLICHPQVSDPTDYKGYPFPDKDGQKAVFLPFGELYEMMNAKEDMIVFFDDMGQAPPAVQTALMQLLLARRVNGHTISDKVTFLAATNRRGDLAGVVGLMEPVKSRFHSIVELEVNLDEWCLWAIEANLPVELIAFIRFRPNMLNDFKPSRDFVNSPCPRTIANVGDWLKDGIDKLSETIQFEAFKGAAGESFASEFMAFLKIYRKLPSIDVILMNPDQADIPEDLATLYATCAALSARAKDSNFDRVIKYLDRIPNETKYGIELPVFAVKDATQRNKKLQNTKAFTDWCIRYGNQVL